MARKKKQEDLEIPLGEDLEGDDDIDEELMEDEAFDEEAPEDLDLDAIADRIESIDEMPIYLKLLVYGEQGTGKTSFAGTAPAPVLFVDCNDRGTLSVRGLGHKQLKANSWDDIETVYWYLATRKHPFKTVVLDTTTQAQDLAMAKVLELDGHEDLPIRRHWGQLVQLCKETFIRFRNLPMNVVFTAQLKRIDEDELSDDETHTRVPMLSPAIRASLGAAVDVIGYTYIKEGIVEKKGRERRVISFRMKVGPNSSILTKARVQRGIKYPPVMKDPSFESIFDIITKEEN